MAEFPHDLVVIHEHPEWQKPLFAELRRRNVNFGIVDLKSAAFASEDNPQAPLYFNQASPSSYVRGSVRAVPYALAFMKALALRGVRVLNGADVFSFELSKTAQASMLRALGINHPRSVTFNSLEALKPRAGEIGFPALVKPEQGGSGARIHFANNFEEVAALFEQNPRLWEPDHLMLLQEYIPYENARGIVRMEFLGRKLLYAMRVVSHGAFNLCPSPVCNPDNGEGGICSLPAAEQKPVEFYPYPDVPPDAVSAGEKVMAAAGIDVGAVEYVDSVDGRRVFYDINANSNLRASVAAAFGFDPFERVAEWLILQIDAIKTEPQRRSP
jgi:hypothetical protein